MSQWEGKFGPAFVTNIITLASLLVGGTMMWTQLTDKVATSSEKLDLLRTAVSSVRVDLQASQTDRAAQSERLGRVETALNFISTYIKLGVNQFDGIAPAPPAGIPSLRASPTTVPPKTSPD